MDFINLQFESKKADIKEVKSTVLEIRSENASSKDDITCLQANLEDVHTRHIDLQCRSMRGNLVFTGILIEIKMSK